MTFWVLKCSFCLTMGRQVCALERPENDHDPGRRPAFALDLAALAAANPGAAALAGRGRPGHRRAVRRLWPGLSAAAARMFSPYRALGGGQSVAGAAAGCVAPPLGGGGRQPGRLRPAAIGGPAGADRRLAESVL